MFWRFKKEKKQETPVEERNTPTTLDGFFVSIAHFQSPDKVSIEKQWRLRGDVWPVKTFKGYMITCTWFGREEDLKVTRDIAEVYQRVIWNANAIPEYTPGKHIRWDQEDSTD